MRLADFRRALNTKCSLAEGYLGQVRLPPPATVLQIPDDHPEGLPKGAPVKAVAGLSLLPPTSPMSLCRAPGCTQARRPRSNYCAHHQRRQSAYGSPLGRPLHRASLTGYAVEAVRIMRANPDHPGLVAATAELQRLLGNAGGEVVSNPRDPFARHFARLAVHGITPEHILAMVAAVGLYGQSDPRVLGTPEEVRYAMARAVCGLAGRQGRRLGARDLQSIGRHLVERYADLAAGIVRAATTKEDSERRRAAAMSEPFTTT